MRMKSRTTESNLTKTFDDIVNTEIPSLQEHTIASTAELELAQAETCLTELSDLCLQITTHLAHTACPADEAEAVKAAFFTEKEACKQLIVSFLAGVTSRFEDTVKNDLEAKLEGGVAEAQRLALDTATAAAASLHHSSWKAVVRRDGVYEKKNVEYVLHLDPSKDPADCCIQSEPDAVQSYHQRHGPLLGYSICQPVSRGRLYRFDHRSAAKTTKRH